MPALRVGKARNKFKMTKHFDIDLTNDSFTFTRKTDQVAVEAALDGRTLWRRRADMLAFFDHTSNGPIEAINGGLEALRRNPSGSATSPTTDYAHSCTAASAPTSRSTLTYREPVFLVVLRWLWAQRGRYDRFGSPRR